MRQSTFLAASFILVIGAICFTLGVYSASHQESKKKNPEHKEAKKKTPQTNEWAKGSYCIFQAANHCPQGFHKEHLYMRGIKMRDSLNPNFISKKPFGKSFMKTHRQLYVPEVSKPYPPLHTLADIEFFLCCKLDKIDARQ